ncbi:MAG: hypothetical protein HWN65_15930 [Candidatus Helarchaeota archaeon]|nr:hypothetical protein [Candidatus Helarchaeota archaeon]
MPRGIALIGWTNKEGFFLIYKYPPEDFELTQQEIMRIGSLHRMRQLDASVITLKLKELNVVSFFSGLITAQYYIAPNFVIALLLEKHENPQEYKKIIPMGAKIVLQEFPVKRFDARTTTFRDVLRYTENASQTLPVLYHAVTNHQIPINEDELAIILAAEHKADKIEREHEQLKEDLKNKESMIETLQDMIKQLSEKIKSEETMSRFKASLALRMEIEELKVKISSIQKQLSDKNQQLKKESENMQLLQESLTDLIDYKLVMQHRDAETREFLKSLLEVLAPHDDEFLLELIDRIEDYLNHIEWIPEMD